MIFSKRELNIMGLLFNYKIQTISELANEVGVGMRTLHNDIDMINIQLEQANKKFRIARQHHQYSWVNTELSEFKKFKIQLNSKLQLKQPWDYENNRIQYILRKLLLANDYIKSRYFQDSLNISDTTLTKDLNLVRSILSNYKLTLIHKPYRGLLIEGLNFSKLCAYVDFSDIYTFQSAPIFHSFSYEELHCSAAEFNQTFQTLSLYCQKFNIEINSTNLLDVTIFAYAAYKQEQPAQSFIDWMNLSLSSKSMLLTYLHLNTDINDSLPIEEYSLNFMLSLSKEIKIDLYKDQQINNYLSNLIHRLNLIKKEGYFKFKYNNAIINLLGYLNVSNTIAFLIFSSLEGHIKVRWHIDLFSHLSLYLYNHFLTIPNSYEKIKILMINPAHKLMNETFIYRSDLDLSGIEVINAYEHEIEKYLKDDINAIIILEESNLNYDHLDIPVFYFNLFVQQKEYRKIWDKVIFTHQKKYITTESFKELKEVHFNFNKKDYPIQYRIYSNYWKEWHFIQSTLLSSNRPQLILFTDSNQRYYTNINDESYLVTELNLNYDLIGVKQSETLIRQMNDALKKKSSN